MFCLGVALPFSVAGIGISGISVGSALPFVSAGSSVFCSGAATVSGSFAVSFSPLGLAGCTGLDAEPDFGAGLAVPLVLGAECAFAEDLARVGRAVFVSAGLS